MVNHFLPSHPTRTSNVQWTCQPPSPVTLSTLFTCIISTFALRYCVLFQTSPTSTTCSHNMNPSVTITEDIKRRRHKISEDKKVFQMIQPKVLHNMSHLLEETFNIHPLWKIQSQVGQTRHALEEDLKTVAAFQKVSASLIFNYHDLNWQLTWRSWMLLWQKSQMRTSSNIWSILRPSDTQPPHSRPICVLCFFPTCVHESSGWKLNLACSRGN